MHRGKFTSFVCQLYGCESWISGSNMQVEQIHHFFIACERMVSAQIVENQGKKRKMQTSFGI
jgi:hypothetical protein